jgi:hypothetical protein
MCPVRPVTHVSGRSRVHLPVSEPVKTLTCSPEPFGCAQGGPGVGGSPPRRAGPPRRALRRATQLINPDHRRPSLLLPPLSIPYPPPPIPCLISFSSFPCHPIPDPRSLFPIARPHPCHAPPVALAQEGLPPATHHPLPPTLAPPAPVPGVGAGSPRPRHSVTQHTKRCPFGTLFLMAYRDDSWWCPSLKFRSCIALCRLACVMAFCVDQFRVFCRIPVCSVLAVELRISQGQFLAAVGTSAALLSPFQSFEFSPGGRLAPLVVPKLLNHFSAIRE